MSAVTRRRFLQTGLSGIAGLTVSKTQTVYSNTRTHRPSSFPVVQTVAGPISADDLGVTLPHEHVMCDFIGAKDVSRDRYDTDEVFRTMLPYLRKVKELGVRTFVDCTSAYIGRDPGLLARLSHAAGLNILTNTGLYKEPYLPAYTWEVSADRLAEMWATEILEGIDKTNVKAGFIKIAVNPGPLIPVQKKLLQPPAGRTI